MGLDVQRIPYSVILIVFAAICVLSIHVTRRRRNVPWIDAGNVMLLIGAMWAAATALSLVAAGSQTETLWDRAQPYAPLIFAVVSLALVWGLTTLRRKDLAEVAQRLVVDEQSDAVLVLDARNCIVSTNDACRRLIDPAPARLDGMPLAEVWPAWAAQVGTLHDGETQIEMALGSKDPRTYQVRISPVADRRGRTLGRVATLRDVSDLKRAEEENRQLYDQLLQARKVEAIGTLAGGIAHDFNNLLTAIQGNATLAKSAIDPDAPVYYDLTEIELACRRAARLTHQLLLFSRKQPVQPEALCLNTVIDELLEMLKRLIGEDVEVSISCAPDLWTAQVDKGSIEQMITNLVVNARDAMPHGGKIAIETRNVVLSQGHEQTTPEAQPGKYVYLEVVDEGMGMDQEVVDRIFEPFFSTKETGKGTGLGLTLVHRIVSQHKGWIQVDSELGRGSTFGVYLPALWEETEKECAQEGTSLRSLGGRGERILLVEDEKSVREFSAKVLGQHGYIVIDVPDVQAAIDALDRASWQFDLVFSDVVLPDRSGLELAEQIRVRDAAFPILLSSGYTGQRSRWETIRERGFNFLQKPYTLTDLLGAVRDAIECVSGDR